MTIAHEALRLTGTMLHLGSSVLGCVACDSAAAHQLRQELFTSDFATRLAMTILPFPVLLLLAFVVCQWMVAGEWKAES